MKNLIWFSIVGSLLITGCTKNSNRQHEIFCVDSSNHLIPTYHITAPGNVFAFVVKGHSVLSYRDEKNEVRIIFLSKNDCEVY